MQFLSFGTKWLCKCKKSFHIISKTVLNCDFSNFGDSNCLLPTSFQNGVYLKLFKDFEIQIVNYQIVL